MLGDILFGRRFSAISLENGKLNFHVHLFVILDSWRESDVVWTLTDIRKVHRSVGNGPAEDWSTRVSIQLVRGCRTSAEKPGGNLPSGVSVGDIVRMRMGIVVTRLTGLLHFVSLGEGGSWMKD